MHPRTEADTPQLHGGIDRDGRSGDAAKPTAQAAEFEYKMGHSSPAGHPFHKRLLEVSDRIAKETAGRMTLTIFPASQLGGDNDLLSQARSGAVDFVQPAGLILASILPVAAVNGMGFAFKDYTQVWAAIDGDLGDYIRAQIATKGGLAPARRARPGVAVHRAWCVSGQHAVRRGLYSAANSARRRAGESAVRDRRRKILRSAEILRHYQPRLGWLLDLRQSRFVEPAAERYQDDRRQGVQRRRVAGTR